MLRHFFQLAVAAVVLTGQAGWAVAAQPEPVAFLAQHCSDCHGEEEPEGEVSLAGLQRVDAENLALWQRVLTQVSSGEMPPDDEPRPTLDEREAVIRWMIAAMAAAGGKPREAGGPLPGDGNLVDHLRLFSGRPRGPAYSPPRFWRRSQPQYDALMEELWVIPRLRYEKAHRRSHPEWAAYSYSQPFPSLEPGQFSDYSASVHADEALLRALMDAGGQIAERLTSDDTAYAKQLQPPHAVGVPSIRRGSPWEKFKREPPARPSEFEPLLDPSRTASPDELQAAVRPGVLDVSRPGAPRGRSSSLRRAA